MACMKCGKKTKDEQVFCPTCLAVMEAHPVKADVRVQLPNWQKLDAAKKANRKRIVPPEEQVVHLRKTLRRARAYGLIVTLLLCAAGLVLLQVFFAPAPEAEAKNPGTNYTYNETID